MSLEFQGIDDIAKNEGYKLKGNYKRSSDFD
jgi:hypothetical protein